VFTHLLKQARHVRQEDSAETGHNVSFIRRKNLVAGKSANKGLGIRRSAQDQANAD
jgi:hypothetical protein